MPRSFFPFDSLTCYTILFYLAVPLLLMRLFWRGRKAPAYRRRWGERFGLMSSLPGDSCLWVHAVSVGEVRAALPLIRALRERYPDRTVLVTTTTPTGSEQVRVALRGSVQHCYIPYDLPGAVSRFLDRSRPRLALVIETELWPNLFHRCKRRGIPLILANARLSERSAWGYARVPGLTAATLDCVTLVAAQSRADAERFGKLGVCDQRLRVTGSIKYDLALPQGLSARAAELRDILGIGRTVLIAASTHAGEDEQVLDACERLWRQRPELLLLLVPRHPERFDPVARLCQRHGLGLVRRSEGRPCGRDTQIFLGDTMGELLLFYAASDVAFVGGSLVPVGGHNVLEPAALGLPVLFGPHMGNFAEIRRGCLDAKAGWEVGSALELAEKTGRLLGDSRLRAKMGQQGRAMVESRRGALTALLGLIDQVLRRDGRQCNFHGRVRKSQ